MVTCVAQLPQTPKTDRKASRCALLAFRFVTSSEAVFPEKFTAPRFAVGLIMLISFTDKKGSAPSSAVTPRCSHPGVMTHTEHAAPRLEFGIQFPACSLGWDGKANLRLGRHGGSPDPRTQQTPSPPLGTKQPWVPPLFSLPFFHAFSLPSLPGQRGVQQLISFCLQLCFKRCSI